MLFSKDGRKITNGDCALFQAGDAPPFIAKISYQIVDKNGDVRLGVNWLYRPGDVKLGKIGEEEKEEVTLPPNEVFYSFHKDEIPGASLLHPCKVAFLGKGVELPSGVSSFICRRVYDITSKCLWWLTDRDYTNEHQEEVDELLNKTRNEMQVTMHSGGLSPRTVNVSAQLKVGSDTIQNGSLMKGKKRERVDQNNELLKRGRFPRPGDSDSGHLKQECNMRAEEIIDITDRDGRIVNTVGVEHLVHLMRQDRKQNMKKGRDLVFHRTMLVGVIATTDQEKCLSQFVHSGGLSILDDWLQEAHKGKSGDSGSPKEGEKAHEDLLLVLLQALGRLPVDLEALKTCNVGKSVNHLRNHKNLDIHKKAKCLVDTWKRRVDEEMKNNDTKSGSAQGISLPCKQGLGDFGPEHGIKGVESTEITSAKCLALLAPSLKAVSSRLSQGDAGKGASVSPSSVNLSVSPSPANSSKDSHYMMPDSGTNDLPVTTTNEDKSSNYNQSQNNSQSCSSSHAIAANTVCKEDVWRSAVGSISSKVSHSTSPHKMLNKGVIGSVQSGNHKEYGSKPLLLSRNMAGEKETHVASEKGADNTRGDGSQRLIVRLPNPLRSPARNLNCGSNVDKIIPGGKGSPSDKNGRHEGKAKTKMNFISNHSSEFNIVSLQSNKTRFVSANPVEECSCNSEDGEEFLKLSKTSQILSPGPGEKDEKKEKAVEAKEIKLHECADLAHVVFEDSSIHSKATLPASVISTELSKVEDSNVAELGTTLPMTGKDKLGHDTKSRCHSKTISARLDDVVWKNALDLKKDHNDYDSMDESQKLEFTAQEQDSHHFSNRALEPGIVPEVGEGNKGSQDDMIWEVSVKCLSWEHDNSGNKMEDCMHSSQDVEQTREVLCTVVEKLDSIGGGAGLVCGEQETRAEPEEHTMHKIGEVDDLGDTKLHAKDIIAEVKVEQSVELCLEEDKKEIENGNQGMVTDGCDACSRFSDSDVSELKVDNLGIIEDSSFCAICQDSKEVGKGVGYEEKAICTKSSNRDAHDVSSLNEKPKTIAIHHFKEQDCNYAGDSEEKGKDEDSDANHIPVTRNLTGLDKSQETMIKKSKSDEVEKTLASAESQEVNQESNESGIVHEKNATTEILCQPILDICDDKMKVDIEECKFSSVPSPIYLADPLNTAVVSLTCVTRQEGHVVTPVTKGTCAAELSSSKQDMTREVLAVRNNGSSIKDNRSSDIAERPDFDLNEAIDLDRTVQHEVMISIPESSLSVVPCANASAVCSASASGVATPITVVAASKGPFIPPVNSVCSIGKLGWRGSAATSAFRPAEPRKTPEQQHLLSELVHIDAASVIGKRSGALLNIDLNVTDEGTLEDETPAMLLSSQQCVPMASSQHRDTNGQVLVALKTGESATSYGLSCSHVKSDLDLNCTDESLENGLIKLPLGKSVESFQSTPKTGTSGLPHSASCVLRNIDLNDGPCFEDTGDRLMAHNSIGNGTYSSCPTSLAGIRMNGKGLNLSSWSPRNGVQALTIASYPSSRAEHPAVAAAIPNSNLSSLSGPNFFGGGDIYKGGKISLSSDSSVSFSNSTAAAYSLAGFPFGSNFPLTSASFSGGSLSYPNSLGPACFPAISSQIVTAGPLSSSYVRPHMMNPIGVSDKEISGTWPKQNLDLNTGPGIGDMDLREDRLFCRHTSLNGPVPLEHMGTLCRPSAPRVLLKRKESGGWDLHRPGCNQPWR